MASFGSDALIGWASMADCQAVLGDLETIVRGDAAKVSRALASASGRAQSILRSRWLESWPFTTPPAEVRDAVAIIATYRAVSSVGATGGMAELVEQLRRDAKAAEAWLADVAAGKAALDIPATPDGNGWDQAYVAAPPRGEFGFSGGR